MDDHKERSNADHGFTVIISQREKKNPVSASLQRRAKVKTQLKHG